MIKQLYIFFVNISPDSDQRIVKLLIFFLQHGCLFFSAFLSPHSVSRSPRDDDVPPWAPAAAVGHGAAVRGMLEGHPDPRPLKGGTLAAALAYAGRLASQAGPVLKVAIARRGDEPTSLHPLAL